MCRGLSRGTHKAMNVAALTLLSTCPNIKKLKLDCNIGWNRTPKRMAGQLYRDGHYFMEALGAANGKKDAVVDVIELSDSNRPYYGEFAVKSEEFTKQFHAELRRMLGC